MKYAVEMGSGATIYILSLIKIGSGTQSLIEGDKQIQTPRRLHKSTFRKQANEGIPQLFSSLA
jgi:hypothetical protein